MSTRYTDIFEKNREWVRRMSDRNPQYFEELAQAQNPDYMFIGCSDSRVPANQIMGLQPGEVFVHRNVSNLVPNTDLSVAGTIEYAVKALNVKHIIVCGHYGCGGVQAAMKPQDMGILNPWLRNIRDVYRLHRDELVAIEEEHARYDRLVELNVEEQCINVIKQACVQESFIQSGFPLVHGWVYDLHNGLLKDLDINFEKILKGVQEIYDLSGGFSYKAATPEEA